MVEAAWLPAPSGIAARGLGLPRQDGRSLRPVCPTSNLRLGVVQSLEEHQLGLDRAGYGRLALNSVESRFAPESLKAKLRDAIDDLVERGDKMRA